MSPKVIWARPCHHRHPSYIVVIRRQVMTVCGVWFWFSCRVKMAEMCSRRRGNFFFPRIPNWRFNASLNLRHRPCRMGLGVFAKSLKKDAASHLLRDRLVVLSSHTAVMRKVVKSIGDIGRISIYSCWANRTHESPATIENILSVFGICLAFLLGSRDRLAHL